MTDKELEEAVERNDALRWATYIKENPKGYNHYEIVIATALLHYHSRLQAAKDANLEELLDNLVKAQHAYSLARVDVTAPEAEREIFKKDRDLARQALIDHFSTTQVTDEEFEKLLLSLMASALDDPGAVWRFKPAVYKNHQKVLAAYSKLRKERDAMRCVLEDLVTEDEQDDSCSLDHHGYCQTHGWMSVNECPHPRARRLLA